MNNDIELLKEENKLLRDNYKFAQDNIAIHEENRILYQQTHDLYKLENDKLQNYTELFKNIIDNILLNEKTYEKYKNKSCENIIKDMNLNYIDLLLNIKEINNYNKVEFMSLRHYNENTIYENDIHQTLCYNETNDFDTNSYEYNYNEILEDNDEKKYIIIDEIELYNFYEIFDINI